MVSTAFFVSFAFGLSLNTSIIATRSVIFDVKPSFGQYTGAGEIVDIPNGERCLIVTQVYIIDGCKTTSPTDGMYTMLDKFEKSVATAQVISAAVVPTTTPKTAFIESGLLETAWMKIRVIRMKKSGGYLLISFKFSEFCNFITTLDSKTYHASAELADNLSSPSYVIVNKLERNEKNFDEILGSTESAGLVCTAIYPTGYVRETNIAKKTDWLSITATNIVRGPSTQIIYNVSQQNLRALRGISCLWDIVDFKIVVPGSAANSTSTISGLVKVDKFLDKVGLSGVPAEWSYLLLFNDFIADGKILDDSVPQNPAAIISIRIDRSWWFLKRITKEFNGRDLSKSYAAILNGTDRQILFWILPGSTNSKIIVEGRLPDEPWKIVIDANALVWEMGPSGKYIKHQTGKSKIKWHQYVHANSGHKFGITWSTNSFSTETWADITVQWSNLHDLKDSNINYLCPKTNFT